MTNDFFQIVQSLKLMRSLVKIDIFYSIRNSKK